MPAPLGLTAPTCDAEGASVRLPVRSRRRFPTPEPDRDTQAGVRVIPGSVRPPGPGATAPSGRPAPGGALGHGAAAAGPGRVGAAVPSGHQGAEAPRRCSLLPLQ